MKRCGLTLLRQVSHIPLQSQSVRCALFCTTPPIAEAAIAEVSPPPTKSVAKKVTPGRLKKLIWAGRNEGNPEKVLDAFYEARSKGVLSRTVLLDMSDVIHVLWACGQLGAGDSRHRSAFWLHDYVKRHEKVMGETVPIEVFNKLMRVCACGGQETTANAVRKDLERTAGTVGLSERFMADFVVAHAGGVLYYFFFLSTHILISRELATPQFGQYMCRGKSARQQQA